MTRVLPELGRLVRLFAARWAVYVLMVAGLALAYCTAILIGLYVQNELTFDRFLPGLDQVYFVSAQYGPEGRALIDSDRTPAGLARWIRSDTPEVAEVARVDIQEWPMRSPRRFVKERFFWADANLFDILRFPVLHGNLRTALNAPGSVVLTRRLALAYFGREDVIGETLTTYKGAPLTVTAVLKDIPANSSLDREMFVSGRGDYAKLYAYDHNPNLLWPNSYTYVTLRPGADRTTLAASMLEISRRHWQGPNNVPDGYRILPLGALHFQPHGDGEMRPRGHLDSVVAMVGVAGAILALACINLSGLILAERNERTAELMVYRALGARRIDLIGRVLAESLAVNVLAAWIGVALAERLLPYINAELGLGLSMWARPIALLAAVSVATAGLVVAGGALPAVILSRPNRPDRRGMPGGDPASIGWRGWVIAQLALVIVLLTASHTTLRQWTFATTTGLGFDANNVVMIKLGDDADIRDAFLPELRTVPGVEAVSLSWGTPTNDFVRPAWTARPGQSMIALTRNSIDPNFMAVYRIHLLAGRNLSGTFVSPEVPKEVLINLQAVKALGFSSPQAAIGVAIDYHTDRTVMHSTIVGVVPDMRVVTLYEPVRPMIFDGFAKYFTQANVRIAPNQMAPTLRRIDAAWGRGALGTVPVERLSFRDYLLQQYHDLHQQIAAFYIVSSLAIILSMLGLTGLSIFLTRHQMKEVAIRRALGATYKDVFVQRLRPFVVPFLISNVVAWPVAWLSITTWFSSFADHVPLSWLSFVGAGIVSIVFGFLTIAINAALSMRSAPMTGLREG